MLIDTIKKENLLALKNKDENKRAILSVIINKYMILGYEAKAKNIELTDADLLNIMKKRLMQSTPASGICIFNFINYVIR